MTSGAILHAVVETGVATRAIAEAIGEELGVPVRSVRRDDAATHFGWIGPFFGMEMAASSARTRELYGWTPTGPTLLEDLRGGSYFRA